MTSSRPRHSLYRLSWAFAILILIAYGLSLWQNWQGALGDTRRSLTHINSAQVQAVHATLNTHELLLKGLGSELLVLGALDHPEKGRDLINRMSKIDGGFVGFGLARTDGQLVLVSGAKAGVKLPNLMSTPEAREGFAQAIKSQRIQIGRPYLMKTLGQWVSPIRVPLHGKSGEVAAVIAAGYSLEASNTGWGKITYPDGVDAALLRDDGYLQFFSPLPTLSLKDIFGKQVHEQTIQQVTALPGKNGFTQMYLARRGGDFYAAYQRIDEFGLLSVALLSKQRVITLWLERMIGPTVLLLLYLGGGWWMSRRFSAQQEAAEKDLQESEARYKFLALHDPLTGLINRYALHQQIGSSIKSGRIKNAALLLIDLDRFKEVNDTLGHHIGDEILQKIGPLLIGVLNRHSALVCRLGGDEFTVYVENPGDEEQLRKIAEEIRNSIKHPFEMDSIRLEIDSSIGIALYPQHGADSHALLRSADVAMYLAKTMGGGYAFYNQDSDQHSTDRLAIMAELGIAIREDQLRLHYQPKFDLRSQRVVGFEALVRWQHPRMGLLYPDSFIPLAEVSDVIHALTECVINMAAEQQKKWQDAGFDFTVAVNLSARNLMADRCIDQLQSLFKQGAIDLTKFEMEVTESALMHDPERAIARLEKIASLGVKLSIDDFGTGYSSLSYLRRLPIDTLKIDKFFVMNMLKNVQDAQIVSSTIDLAHGLNLRVVAEGVEDGETLALLQKNGCDAIQGYYISRPMEWDKLRQHLKLSPLT